jgi:putative endonuclease
MEDGDCVVFVEVRYRASDRWGNGLESIVPAKRRRLVNTARSFLKKHPALKQRACRFDVVAITGKHSEPSIRWVRHAFADAT